MIFSMGLIIVVVILIMLVLTRVVTFLMLDVMMLSDAFEVRLELTMALLPRQRTDLHVDVAARHLRLLIALSHGLQVLFDLPSKLMSELLVSHLTATELKLDAHLVTFGEEVFSVNDLDMIVVRIDSDAELHFLHLAALLVLVRLFAVLLLDVLVFAVVDDFAHGRVGIRCDLDQIQPTLLGNTDGLMRWQNTQLMLSILFNHTHLRRTNALIDACLIHEPAVWAIPPTRAVLSTWTIKRCTTSSRSVLSRTWKTSRRTRRSRRPRCLTERPRRTRRCVLWACGTRRSALILLWARREITAVQLLEWIAYGIPPGGFKTPDIPLKDARKIIWERRTAIFIISAAAQTRFRQVRSFLIPIMRGEKTRQRKNHAGKVRWKSASHQT